MRYTSEMSKALGWFESAGVDSWNLAVLSDRGMLNHDRVRDAAEMRRSCGWGWVQNDDGKNVYMRPSRGASWPVIFLDDLKPDVASHISKKYSTLVIETSKGNCQAWLRCAQSLTEPERAACQKALAPLIGADAASTSGDHFGRAPGFRNQKPGRNGFIVTVASSTHGTCLDTTPHLSATTTGPIASLDLPLPTGGRVRLQPLPAVSVGVSDGTQSAAEFRFCLARFRWSKDRGRDPSGETDFLIKNITQRALERGKRGTESAAQKYAEITVIKALAAFSKM